MANTKVTGDLIASSTIATGNIADNAVTSDKISGITTAHIAEGSNLYYTNARTDARVNLQTGANLSLSNKSTSDLSEGTNLYYTDARADARAALLVDSAPSTLDTLNELAAALGDDPNFATTTATNIGLKAPLASPSFTGVVTIPGAISAGTNGGLRIHSSGTKFFNVTAANAARNNIMDIGAPDAKFKDLYLGGSITAGAATFAGNVTLDNILLTPATIPGANTPSINLHSTNNEIYIQSGSAHIFNFIRYDNRNSMMNIESTGISVTGGGTFAGNVKVTGANSLLIRDDGTFIKEDQGLQIGNTSGTGASRPIRFFTESTERMRIDSSGDVGIGTTSPFSAAKLDVNGNIYAKATAATIDVVAYNTTSGLTDADLHLAATSSGEGQVRMYGNYPLTFYTNNAERMRIRNTGSIFMGHESVAGIVTGLQLMNPINAAGTGHGTSILLHCTDGDPNRGVKIASSSTSNYAINNDMLFYTSAGSTLTEKMRITSGGQVIMGVGSPPSDAKLMVVNGNTGLEFSCDDAVANTARLLAYDRTNNVHRDLQLRGDGIQFYTGLAGTEKMRITSGGDVLINLTGPITSRYSTSIGTTLASGYSWFASNDSLYVQRPDGTNGNAISFFRASVSTGSISLSGSATAYNTSSDYRLKEDLQDFAGLDKVSKIPVYDFKWKSDESRSYGVMAHELQEVLPDGVSGEKDAEEMQGVDYSKIVPLLIKAIQELKADNDSLKARIETLEN